MRILIFGDIHGRDFWKKPLEDNKDKVDKIIFLGDYLDPYPWENITRKETIRNFEEIIDSAKNNNKVILLLGNHDVSYIDDFFRRNANGGRHDNSNHYHIARDFSLNQKLFKLCHEETIEGKKYLFSHSGVCKSWYNANKDLIGEPTVDNFNALLHSRKGIESLCDVSRYRGGWAKSGSIVWSDVRERNDDNSEELDEFDYQIFGHTQLESEPIIKEKWANLDCRKAFILNENLELTNC